MTRHRLLLVAVLAAVVGVLVTSGQTAHAGAPDAGPAAPADAHEPVFNTLAASTVQWVDGGDDSPCLNDDTGRALSALPSDKWCSPILGCYQADDGKWVLPSRSTGIWQGDPSEVKYADEINTTPTTTTPTPTTPTPTTPTPTTPTPTTPAPSGPGTSPTPTTPAPGGSATSPTPGATTGTPAATGPTGPGATPSAPTGGEPTAPGAPTLTAAGSELTVTWAPHADAEAQGVTGQIVEISGIAPVQLDALATTHTFTGIPDGTYVAVVRAVNAAGASPSSLPSNSVTVGAPVASVVGTVQVAGSLVPGGTVTITGTGYARNVPDLQVELHSTPVLLGAVGTDTQGGFSASVALPATVEPGDHNIVVVHNGVEVSRTPVLLGAAAVTDTLTTAAASGSTPSVVGLAALVVVVAASAAALIWYRRRSSTLEPTGAPQPPAPTAEHVPAPADPQLTRGIPGVR